MFDTDRQRQTDRDRQRDRERERESNVWSREKFRRCLTPTVAVGVRPAICVHNTHTHTHALTFIHNAHTKRVRLDLDDSLDTFDVVKIDRLRSHRRPLVST